MTAAVRRFPPVAEESRHVSPEGHDRNHPAGDACRRDLPQVVGLVGVALGADPAASTATMRWVTVYPVSDGR